MSADCTMTPHEMRLLTACAMYLMLESCSWAVSGHFTSLAIDMLDVFDAGIVLDPPCNTRRGSHYADFGS
jgi:hypothetical protein